MLAVPEQIAMMIDKSSAIVVMGYLSIMRVKQQVMLQPDQIAQAQDIGRKLARLRLARGIRQEEAATRAGISRNTAYRLEKGDASVAIGQILRYLNTIAPGHTLIDLITESDPSLVALAAKERTQRAKPLSKAQLDALDF